VGPIADGRRERAEALAGVLRQLSREAAAHAAECRRLRTEGAWLLGADSAYVRSLLRQGEGIRERHHRLLREGHELLDAAVSQRRLESRLN
jgi:hypothetical protein